VGVLTTNLLDRRTPNYDGLASAVVSLPPLASAGLTEAAARGAGLAFRTSRQDTSGWFNTRRVGETTAGSKVLIEEGTDRIIGAHLLGPHADEVIAALSMRAPRPFASSRAWARRFAEGPGMGG
jgi:glutathione reductase (NADPH)